MIQELTGQFPGPMTSVEQNKHVKENNDIFDLQFLCVLAFLLPVAYHDCTQAVI